MEDWRKESPGFKFNEWEMKGVPLRLEIGLRDIQNGKLTLQEETAIKKLKLIRATLLSEFLNYLIIQSALFNQALEFRSLNTHTAKDMMSSKI